MAFLTLTDIEPFADIDESRAVQMIEDATAIAILVAPCLTDEDELTAGQKSAVKAVLRGAVLRWNDAGSGVVSQESVGSFSQSIDTANRRGLFWPSEIEQLQQICRGDESGGAFSLDTAPTSTLTHAETCALRFDATYCSCGAVLSGAGPIYEL